MQSLTMMAPGLRYEWVREEVQVPGANNGDLA